MRRGQQRGSQPEGEKPTSHLLVVQVGEVDAIDLDNLVPWLVEKCFYYLYAQSVGRAPPGGQHQTLGLQVAVPQLFRKSRVPIGSSQGSSTPYLFHQLSNITPLEVHYFG